MGWNLSAT